MQAIIWVSSGMTSRSGVLCEAGSVKTRRDGLLMHVLGVCPAGVDLFNRWCREGGGDKKAKAKAEQF